MNTCQLMGRLTKDPELKTTAKGMPYTRFTIAVDKRKAEGADFIPVIAWRKTAEFISKHFQKGLRIALTGSIETGYWEDDKGKHNFTQVLAEAVFFADAKKESVVSDGGYDEDIYFEEIAGDEEWIG